MHQGKGREAETDPVQQQQRLFDAPWFSQSLFRCGTTGDGGTLAGGTGQRKG